MLSHVTRPPIRYVWPYITQLRHSTQLLHLSSVCISHGEEGASIGDGEVESRSDAQAPVIHVAADVHRGDRVDGHVALLGKADVSNVEVDGDLELVLDGIGLRIIGGGQRYGWTGMNQVTGTIVHNTDGTC